jgi:hypothetical protein
MNWGYRILIVLLAFLGGIFFMVSVAMKQSNEMMDEHYYKKELVHQQVIDASKNLSQLNVQVHIIDSGSFLRVQLPGSAAPDSGTISFVRPSDQRLDRTEALVPGNQVVTCSKSKLQTGMYLVRVGWKSGATPYYFEQKYFVTE